jgi:hypothetical protein
MSQNQYNIAYATNYRLEFLENPNLNYFIQSAQLPGVSAIGVTTPYKKANIYMQADRIEFDPLSINFLVDETFENYMFLHNWMMRDITKETPPTWHRDATLHILTANKTPNLMIHFHGLFIQMIGSLDFESAVGDTSPLNCQATFRYQDFIIEKAT